MAMVTTMWDSTDPKIGAAREQQLKSQYWLPFLEQGGFYCRFDKSRSSALSIIETLMKNAKDTLQVQHEMVDQHKTLKNTDAGQEIQRIVIVFSISGSASADTCY